MSSEQYGTPTKEKTSFKESASTPLGHPCIICGATPSEKAHYPITEKMGGILTIPLCHYHHIGELHQWGVDTFTKKYKKQIRKYFYQGG